MPSLMPFRVAESNPRHDLEVLDLCDGQTSKAAAARRLAISKSELEAILERLEEQGLTAPAEMPRCHDYLAQPIADELVLYHRFRTGLVLLNAPARKAYELCDGETPVHEAAKQLGGLDLLWLTLGEFRKHRLIPHATRLAVSPGRRAFLRTCAQAAAVFPVITLAAAPTPVAAASTCIDNAATALCATAVGSGIPTNCASCCSSTMSAFCSDDCSGGSCGCFCMQARSCVPDCGSGSCQSDTPANAICVEDGTSDGCLQDGFNVCQRNCDDARAAADMASAAGGYRCCENCS
ncbi:MAG: hypothetical protein AB7S38_22220 [Vulcanimicrobiota bacterium]